MNSNTNFLSIIAESCSENLQDKSHFEIQLQGLETFLKFPGCSEAALFLIDADTFDLYFKLVIPWRDESVVKQELNEFTAGGVITEVLNSGKIITVPLSGTGEKSDLLIVPLIAHTVYGIVFLRMSRVHQIVTSFYDALRVYAYQYTLRLILSQQQSNIQYLHENVNQIASVSASHLSDTDIEVIDFLDKFPTGILLVRKADGIIISANTSAAFTLGTSKENIVSRSIDEFLFKARMINPGDIVTAEESIIRKKNGDILSIHHNRAEVIMGGTSFWIDIFLDLTERKYLEGELQKNREELENRVRERTERLQEINIALKTEITERTKAESELFKFYWAVQQNPVSIILADHFGIVEYVNPQYCEITGYKYTEVIGKEIVDLIGVDRSSRQYQDYWVSLKRKLSWQGEHTNHKKNGEIFWVESVVSPVVNFEGEVKNYVAVQEDITRRRLTEEQMRIAKEKAEDADKLKSSIFANMSHEFRTPLISILGFSQILTEEISDPDFKIMTNNIYSAGNRLLRTLNNVLFLAQADTLHSSYSFGRLELNEYVNNVLKMFKPAANEKSLEVFTHLSETPLFINSPAEFPEMLLTQLIDNAIKFTRKGHIRIATNLVTNANGESRVMLEVSDTGIGIGTEFQKTIFQPFQQESAGYSRVFEGSGLGLAVTMKATEILSGTLDLESKLGEGSTFRISLPTWVEKE